MSLWALTENGTKIFPRQALDRKDIVCPYCGAHMHVVGLDSDKVTPHFSGTHTANCIAKRIDDSYGTVLTTGLTLHEIEQCYGSVLNNGIRSRQNSSRVIGGHDNQYHAHSVLKPHTFRQLFSVLANSDLNTILSDDGTCVKNILCASTTQFLYTKYVHGFHFVYAEYNWYAKDRPLLYFNYPSHENKNFTLRVEINDENLFAQIKQMLVRHYHKPVLIVAIFEYNCCTISSLTQIIPM